VRAILAAVLPTSLATFLLEETNVDPHTNISSLKKADRASLVQHLVAYPLSIDSNEGFPKAEVTSGGVPLDDLDIATMQLRDVPGLHVIGELVDVHGRIGGFNFLLAWWQGRLAGRAVAANII
jgi:predicted flavoprotein YhiN